MSGGSACSGRLLARRRSDPHLVAVTPTRSVDEPPRPPHVVMVMLGLPLDAWLLLLVAVGLGLSVQLRFYLARRRDRR